MWCSRCKKKFCQLCLKPVSFIPVHMHLFVCKASFKDKSFSYFMSIFFLTFCIFFYQKSFCHVASHIWQETCQYEDREYFLRKRQPILCQVLQYFAEFFGDARNELNAEEICEGHGFSQTQCEAIGCCHWNNNDCLSHVGQELCFEAGTHKKIALQNFQHF